MWLIMVSDVLKTKYGNAKIIKGYYIITSRKEGNHLKFLHRMIWEDFYGCKIPEGYVIHHKNGDKLDNCILNLQLMRNETHCEFHSSGENNAWYGKNHNLDSIKKMSKSRNNVGYFRVGKRKCKRCKQGFIYAYRTLVNKNPIIIKSVSLEKLEEKVKARGLEWAKL